MANAERYGDGLTSDAHLLPAVHVTHADGALLKDWLALNPNPTAVIEGMTLDYSLANGDRVARFSSRGPNQQADVIKPDVAAPGVDIWTAVHSDGLTPAPEFGFNSGTSLAGSHVAGAAALIRALHPDWTVAEIKSALMTTARTAVAEADGVTPADPLAVGAGRIDLTQAAATGLVLDETGANYLAADPNTGGDPRMLNMASMSDSHCMAVCGWTRTVRNVLATDVTWTAAVTAPAGIAVTVTPASFTLAAGATQALAITADVSGLPVDSWSFATVVLTANGAAAPDAHLPVAVMPVSDNLPDRLDIDSRRDAGSTLLADLETIEIAELTVDLFGLAPATKTSLTLSQDPTAADPYDNLNDGTTFFTTVPVPAGAARLVAETLESTATDIDLFVGTGAIPNAASQVCVSIGGTAVEYCDVDKPAAGEWWILAQNRVESAGAPDALTLAYAVVAGDQGNMRVEAPASAPGSTPFDLRLYWDEPDMVAGDLLYGAFSLGSDPAHPGNVGTVRVDLARLEDDVTKTVSAMTAVPGDILTYTITVQPNVTGVNLAYNLTDTIPAGMTYVPGSARASKGVVTVDNDRLTWASLVAASNFTYAMATSQTDPACAAPLAASDGDVDAYLDLAAFNIFPDPRMVGDRVQFTAEFGGGPYDFFGADQGDILNFTDDGFAFFNPATAGATQWINEPIPTMADPNNLLALLWRDLTLVYDAALNRGVSLASLTSGGAPVAAVLEFDDAEQFPAGAGLPTYDFELIAFYEPSPTGYEYIFAYDNLTGADGMGTIGLENATGTEGVQYAHNNVVLTDGMAICFDLVSADSAPVTITYQVTVDPGAHGTLTNNARHINDDPGSREANASVAVTILTPPPSLARLYVTSNSSGNAGGVPYRDEDIMAYDLETGVWSLYFDGSDMKLRRADIDAVYVEDDGSILMSFHRPHKIAGLGKVDDSDIIRFVPTSLGEETAGHFEWFLDGSDVGLRQGSEDVDAIGFAPDGRLLVSVHGGFKVPQSGGGRLRGRDDDLIVFNADNLGRRTRGDWEFYFDGSDVWDHSEDIRGLWVEPTTGDIYVSLKNAFAVDGASGDGRDIFICHPQSLGEDTACIFGPGLFFDGTIDTIGDDRDDRIDGFSLGN